MRFALLTCTPLPEPDADEAPLLAAVRAIGHEAETVVWDDPTAAFDGFDALLPRATWDYARKADAFRAWLGRSDVATRLINPADAVLWNLDKRYLLELEANGIPIVPTAVTVGDEPVSAIAATRGWDDIVVKPTVSAGSANTRRFTGDAIGAADGFVRTWSDPSPAMVQPYLRSVEGGDAGEPERAIIWFGGSVSHVIEKSRRFAGDDESVRARPTVTDEEREFAARVIDACGHDVLYARVDVMQGDDGGTLLSELELIEPSLFFPHAPGSAARFAEASVAWLERRLRR
jgi:glutathione synthase/RimK-type ligase-like ATP-grasp enzyme